jgi:hypothetical protein
LFLTGKSGVGKTSSVVELLENYNPLIIRDVNGLKELKEDNKALIFDDIEWSSIPRETKIHLIDKEYVSDIRILYGVAKLSDNLIKVVISNNSQDLVSLWSKNDDAIARRLVHVNVDDPMYSDQKNIFINCDFNLIQNNKKE